MQKYVIIKLLEPVDEGFEFPMTQWPLHVTLAPNFVIDKTVAELSDILEKFATSQYPVSATGDEDDYFGPLGQVHVTKLAMNPNLRALHLQLIRTFRDNGAVFDDPQYIEDGYVAHATVWGDKRIHRGEEIIFDEVTLVDMFPGSDIKQRKILKTIQL